MAWDVDKMGYQAFCPVCGKVLMLCEECTQQYGDTCDFHYVPDGNGNNIGTCKMRGNRVKPWWQGDFERDGSIAFARERMQNDVEELKQEVGELQRQIEELQHLCKQIGISCLAIGGGEEE
jgi:hypothetical protein